MFEAAELGRTVTKDDYRDARTAAPDRPARRADRLRDAPFPVIVVFAGVDGAGKGETVNLLNAWMDPRWIVTRAFGTPSDEERERPEYWRYWRNLPPRGRIGLFLSAWYSRPCSTASTGASTRPSSTEQLDRIVDFERTLADDGALILKFWMHLDKARQKKRLTKLEKDPLTRWRVTKLDWKHWRMYDRFIDAAERTIRRTSRGDAPWIIVEGADANYRSLAVGTAVRDAIRQRLETQAASAAHTACAKSAAVPKAPARAPPARRPGPGRHPPSRRPRPSSATST